MTKSKSVLGFLFYGIAGAWGGYNLYYYIKTLIPLFQSNFSDFDVSFSSICYLVCAASTAIQVLLCVYGFLKNLGGRVNMTPTVFTLFSVSLPLALSRIPDVIDMFKNGSIGMNTLSFVLFILSIADAILALIAMFFKGGFKKFFALLAAIAGGVISVLDLVNIFKAKGFVDAFSEAPLYMVLTIGFALIYVLAFLYIITFESNNNKN